MVVFSDTREHRRQRICRSRLSNQQYHSNLEQLLCEQPIISAGQRQCRPQRLPCLEKLDIRYSSPIPNTMTDFLGVNMPVGLPLCQVEPGTHLTERQSFPDFTDVTSRTEPSFPRDGPYQSGPFRATSHLYSCLANSNMRSAETSHAEPSLVRPLRRSIPALSIPSDEPSPALPFQCDNPN